MKKKEGEVKIEKGDVTVSLTPCFNGHSCPPPPSSSLPLLLSLSLYSLSGLLCYLFSLGSAIFTAKKKSKKERNPKFGCSAKVEENLALALLLATRGTGVGGNESLNGGDRLSSDQLRVGRVGGGRGRGGRGRG